MSADLSRRPSAPARPTYPHRPLDPDAPPRLREAMQAWGRQQGLLVEERARLFLDIDLTMAQLRALSVIRHAGRVTGRDLATRLHVTPGTLVPLFDRLEESGYVQRVPDLDDRRLTWLQITPKGERVFHRLWATGTHWVTEAIAHLSPADQEQFARLLNRIADYIEAQRGPRSITRATA